MTNVEITQKISDASKQFIDLVNTLADDTLAADELLEAHAAWTPCYTGGDCDAFLNLPQMAAKLDDKRRADYFEAHPEKILAQVPQYLDDHPELLSNYLTNVYSPSFMIRSAHYLNENSTTALGATMLLAVVLITRLTIGNPLRWCGLFKKNAEVIHHEQKRHSDSLKRDF